MKNSTRKMSSNLHITGSQPLNEYDFRASSFYDGYMSMTVMAGRIENDIKFEEKLKKLYEEKETKERGKKWLI